MEKAVRVGEQSYNIVPIEIKHFGPLYDRFQDLEGWCITVNFKGNILALAYQPDLCRKYGIFPRGAEMIYRDYSSARDTTQIGYMFNSGLFKKRCEKRATNFKDAIQNKMNQNNNTRDVDNGGNSMKKRIDILQPINVSGVYTVLKDPQTLKGFRVTVTYNGRSNINQKHSNKIDVFPTKRGCKFGNVVYDDDKTSVDYIFRDGLFLPDSMARAIGFRKNVKEFVNLEPVDVSGVGVWYYSMRSGTWVLNGAVDEDCICMGYDVTVSYPGNLIQNGLLKYYIEEPRMKVAAVQYNALKKTTDVSYYVARRDFMDRQDAYKHAAMFRNMMHCRIAGTQRNENIK